MTLPAWSIPAALGAWTAALIGWNLSVGAQLSALPGSSRMQRVVAGLAAFLCVPALAIALLAPGATGARVLGPLIWLWPVVTLGFAVQSLTAIARTRGSLLVAAALLLFNGVAAWTATTRWLAGEGIALPLWVLTPGMAVASVTASLAGAWAFAWGTVPVLPLLVPVTPAPQRLGRAVRVVLAVGCAAAVSATVLALPRAHEMLRATRALDTGVAEVSARSELAIGFTVFGPVIGSPSGALARADVALADSLGATAVGVTLVDGVTTAALDSVARAVEPRRDSIALVVSLRLPSGDAARAVEGEQTDATIERIVRRVRPSVLLPAAPVSLGPPTRSLDEWKAFYRRAAAAAHRANRRVVIALATDASSPTDSALVDWVMRGQTPVGAVALTVGDASDPGRFADALNALARWASLARTVPDVWIVGVPAAPDLTGEVVQQQLVRHALLWGAAHSWVRGVIAGEASDIITASGLRTASGRARRALAEVATALRLQREATAAASAIAVPDSSTAGGRTILPDSLSPPRP